MTEWTVALTSPGRRSLTRLPPRMLDAAVRFINGPLTENPYRVTKPLTGDFIGKRSARVGDYRIIVEIADEIRIVRVEHVGHRSTVYRPR